MALSTSFTIFIAVGVVILVSAVVAVVRLFK